MTPGFLPTFSYAQQAFWSPAAFRNLVPYLQGLLQFIFSRAQPLKWFKAHGSCLLLVAVLESQPQYPLTSALLPEPSVTPLELGSYHYFKLSATREGPELYLYPCRVKKKATCLTFSPAARPCRANSYETEPAESSSGSPAPFLGTPGIYKASPFLLSQPAAVKLYMPTFTWHF